jgi:hypothetical protein
VAELEEMPSDELTHWMAFSLVEPLEGYRIDLGFALIAAILANVNRDRNSKPFSIQDFVTDYWEEWTKKIETPQDFKAQMMAWAASVGVKKER